jgi:hypothetical protein
MTSPLRGETRAGVGEGNITPPAGTPSAGYGNRLGRGMTGTHDSLLARALVLDDGNKTIAFVGVDHLGYNSAMVQAVKKAVHDNPSTARWEVYIGSSHTHSGGGAYLDLPGLGPLLAGKFDPAIVQLYVDGAIKAVHAAASRLEPAKVGIGHGKAETLNRYRGNWPPNVKTLDDVAVIKVTRATGSPLGVFFNFAAHATVLSGSNLEFSADFVGYARKHIEALIGDGVTSVYFNGAQGDVAPNAPGNGDAFQKCDAMGKALAQAVKQIWDATDVSSRLKITSAQHTYNLEPQTTGTGLKVGLGPFTTEINAIVLNDRHAFVTIPGELSCIYDADIKRFGAWLGFTQVSILGLTNDAHGYIITPESWRHQTYESSLSFGGEFYGQRIEDLVFALLHALEPEGAFNKDKTKPSSILRVPVR